MRLVQGSIQEPLVLDASLDLGVSHRIGQGPGTAALERQGLAERGIGLGVVLVIGPGRHNRADQEHDDETSGDPHWLSPESMTAMAQSSLVLQQRTCFARPCLGGAELLWLGAI